MIAISALFFLQGARLSRDAVLRGIGHWRLHAAIGATTFVVFPILGMVMAGCFPRLLPRLLWTGVLFVTSLPSTVQSSVALTSVAEGNVAGAICAATTSNLVGIILAPLIFDTMSAAHGGQLNISAVGQVALELLVPFIAGHMLRPWIGDWAGRNRAILSVTDRGAILLVVYGAFSAAVVHGIWTTLPPATVAALILVVVLLLVSVLLFTLMVSRAMRFHPEDEVAAVFCGSQKSLVSGVPIANVLFPAASVGQVLIPLMAYYQIQLLVCAWLARRYAVARHSEPVPLAVPE
jgi:sodium/bile acid cotransporter 7